MKKCKIVLILALILSLCLAGCSQNKSSSDETKKEVQKKETKKVEAMYELKSETFKDKDVVINYPQLINLSDTTAQDKINKIIKDQAFLTYNDVLKQGEEFSYELKYDVKYCSPELLSIRFNGYINFIQSAHPSNFVQTLNINIKDQKTVKLNDIVNINEGFVDLFKKGKYLSPYPDQPPELMESINSFLKETDTKGWIELLKTSDSLDINNGGQYSYFTKDGLVIVVSVPHFMGDFAEFQINYKDLSDYKKTDNEVWQFLNEK
ncbi:PdaC/SigV domain-containing protein [Aminipila terrae]|uniref:DUF4163 domain-containing protein n=1 Tax=Aminipila terrae TaxID=2697030 RepID=A0A6P1MC80_9FIRM|nr:DUF4163 domain-containing protein [Aminipila terrae]QHI71632.1 DUF4163 domain-containing protein [Aminipila terrae]